MKMWFYDDVRVDEGIGIIKKCADGIFISGNTKLM